MIRSDHQFDGEADFKGMILGDVTVAPGARLVLRGMVKGDLIVSHGAHVELLGMVKGDVTLAQDAHLVLGGMVGQVINHGGTISYKSRPTV
ncbi:MAG: hypothetical protein KGJ57_08940 [Sphingomonadales bacterium]|nr:hypothetical protein [Sphingomonadales bacterium]MDE2169536.1 hypothetical protein [Sphingomonadales bacterium]